MNKMKTYRETRDIDKGREWREREERERERVK